MGVAVVVEARLAAGTDNGTIGLQGHLCGLTGVMALGRWPQQLLNIIISILIFDYNLPCNYRANLWCGIVCGCCYNCGVSRGGEHRVLLIKRKVEREKRVQQKDS